MGFNIPSNYFWGLKFMCVFPGSPFAPPTNGYKGRNGDTMWLGIVVVFQGNGHIRWLCEGWWYGWWALRDV